MRSIAFRPAKIRGKQRHRTTREGRTYTPRETLEAQAEIAAEWIAAYPGEVPTDSPLCLTIDYRRARPASWPKRPRDPVKAIRALFDMCKPDVDNVAKLVMDALEGVAYVNDKQVCQLHVSRMRPEGGENYMRISLEEL